MSYRAASPVRRSTRWPPRQSLHARRATLHSTTRSTTSRTPRWPSATLSRLPSRSPGLRAASSLVVLLVLPLALPVLVFGCLAVSALDAGLPATPHLSLLGALLLLAIVALPPTIAAALRTSLG